MVIPVVGSLLLTVGVVGMGAALIVERAWNLWSRGDLSPKAAKLMSVTVIETIDFFLVGGPGLHHRRRPVQPVHHRQGRAVAPAVQDRAAGGPRGQDHRGGGGGPGRVDPRGRLERRTDARRAVRRGRYRVVIGALCLFMYFSKKSG
jgi:hypothetical protein